jgi:hypothetical protein
LSTIKREGFGRPTKYEEHLCEDAFYFLSADKCRGVTALAAHFKVDEKTIYNWMRKHGDFKSAVERGMTASKHIMLQEASKNLVSSRDFNYNTPLFSRLMTSVYKDSETSAVVIDGWREAKTNEEKMDLIIQAMCDGLITPDQADRITNVLKKKIELQELTELKARLDKLEKSN